MVTISRLNRLLITLIHHVRTHFLENLTQKYSRGTGRICEYFFIPPPSFELGYLSIRVGVSTNWAKPLNVSKNKYTRIKLLNSLLTVAHIVYVEV